MANISQQESKNVSGTLSNQTAIRYLNESSNLPVNRNKYLEGTTSNMTAEQKKLQIIENFGKLHLGIKKVDNDTYIFNDRKLNREQMLQMMVHFHKEDIKKIFEHIEILNQFKIQIQKKNIQINSNKQQKIILKQKKNNLKNNWKILSKELSKNNRKLIDAYYKQGRIESGMRSQLAQVMFQKQNIHSKFQNIKHNSNMGINKMNALNIINESRKSSAYMYRSMVNNHNDNLFNKLNMSDIDDADAKAKLKLLVERNKLLKQQLDEHSALSDEFKQNVQKMINDMKELAENMKLKMKEEQDKLKIQLGKLADDIKHAIDNAADKFNDDFKKFAADIIKQLDINRQQDQIIIQEIKLEIEKGIDYDKQFIHLIPEEIDPNSLMPPACGKKLPPGCQGTKWALEKQKYRNKHTGTENITMYRCNANGHYCTSDGGVGEWDSRMSIYEYM
jgi:hypothetical protein